MKNTKLTQAKAIWCLSSLIAILIVLCFIGCGSTKVSVQKPQNGTSTTITVTTNNPITTNVEPTTDLNLEKK